MYDYRRMTPEQQRAAVAERQRQNYPWHSPPHLSAVSGFCIVTGACYEHRHVLHTSERLAWFEQHLLEAVAGISKSCAAWCVLPNHYHLLVEIDAVQEFSKGLGALHGRTSYEMNREDGCRGRKVWYRCQDRAMRSDRHYYASLNYIHNNPVKHGYVQKWQEWPYSSASWYLAQKGRDWLVAVWKDYPLYDYGEDWDIF